jgi:oligopeptide transport system ATP-binding protein
MLKPLLTVDKLHVEFPTEEGVVRAVDGVSFDLRPGEMLGIVGESGSGKSVTSLAIMGLVAPPGRITAGSVVFDGLDLRSLSQKQFQQLRGKRMAMIFQDPMTALNPFLTVEEQLTEVTRLHLGHTQAQARKHALEMLERVGIPGAERRLDDYPHQFSGGMRQRVMIAMALTCKPQLLIADEPTTALDVTIQAQILELMRELQQQEGTAILLITHALGVVANVCQRVLVMYAGKEVEEAPVGPLFADPRHPYTLGLLNSSPRWDVRVQGRLPAIAGQPPHMADPPSGCPFHPRCPFSEGKCTTTVPPLVPRPDVGRHACLFDITQKSKHPVKAEEEARG